MTRERFDELRNLESEFVEMMRAAQHVRGRLIEALEEEDLEPEQLDYDWERDRIEYVFEGPDDDFTGPRIIFRHSLEEMVNDRAFEVDG